MAYSPKKSRSDAEPGRRRYTIVLAIDGGQIKGLCCVDLDWARGIELPSCSPVQIVRASSVNAVSTLWWTREPTPSSSWPRRMFCISA